MEDRNETLVAVIKSAVMWIGALLGNMTLSKWVLFATLIYTVLQTYVLIRDKLSKRKECEK